MIHPYFPDLQTWSARSDHSNTLSGENANKSDVQVTQSLSKAPPEQSAPDFSCLGVGRWSGWDLDCGAHHCEDQGCTKAHHEHLRQKPGNSELSRH